MENIFNINKVAQSVSGEMRNCAGDAIISSVSTDTRSIAEGALFVALKGENSDGHLYLEKAIKNGAVCCIAERGADIQSDIPVILVKSSAQALLDLAGAYRREMKIPVVAVTGSVGKTSTRGMIASVLSQKYSTLATDGNFNNEIGVPHTLFRIDKKHEIAVIEMGMNHFGELSRITAAVRPDTVVITNVGEAHIENLGSREGILKAKLETLEGLSSGGTVVLNGDNDMLWGLSGDLDFETLYCGIENSCCDLIAKNVTTHSESTEFTVFVEGKERKVIIGVPGIHHVYNALTAMLVGMKYDVAMDDILLGIYEFAPDGMRQAAIEFAEHTVIKDCYNANPTSMKAGLEVLSLKDGHGRRVACLGDMMELGTISEKAHYDIGRLVPSYKVDCLITVGKRAKLIAKGAEAAGMDSECIYSFSNNDELCGRLYDILKKGDIILLKASRSMKLEEIAEFMERTERVE